MLLSEVGLAVSAAALFASSGIPVRVVSMPCVERFLAQSDDWRSTVRPPGGPVVVLEAGRTAAWGAVTGARPALHLETDRHGASAPAGELKHFGFTLESMALRVKAWPAG